MEIHQYFVYIDLISISKFIKNSKFDPYTGSVMNWPL